MKTQTRAGRWAAIAALAMLVSSPSWLAAQAAPAGARFLCKDGTYSTASTATTACAKHAGVAKTLPAPSAAPAPTTPTKPTPIAASAAPDTRRPDPAGD